MIPSPQRGFWHVVRHALGVLLLFAPLSHCSFNGAASSWTPSPQRGFWHVARHVFGVLPLLPP